MATKKKETKALAIVPKKADRAPKKKEMTIEVGRSGTPSYAGYISQDYNNEFNGKAGVDLCDRMRRTDGTVAAALRAVKYPIMASEWTVESADREDDRQNEIQEFVRANLFDRMDFVQFLREAMGYLDFGFWYFEKIYKMENGWLMLDRLASRLPTAHECWEMRSTHKPGVTQTLPSRAMNDDGPTQPEIPMDKLVLFVNDMEGDNMAGTALLRGAYKHFFMKDQLYRIDAVKHERGAGILKIRCPAGKEEQEKGEELGRNYNINEQAFIVLPGPKPEQGQPGWDAEIMTAGIADQSAALMQSVTHHDRLIVQSVLASFLNLGASGGSGSYALGDVQQGFFGYALKATADYMSSVINNQVIKELVDMNFGRQVAYPKVRAPRVGQIDQKQTAEILSILNVAGLIDRDAELKSWVTHAFGLPERTPEDFEDEEEDSDSDIDIDDNSKEVQPQEDNEPEDMNESGEDAAALKMAQSMRLARRALTVAESRVRFNEAKDNIDKAEENVKEMLAKATEAQKNDLLDKAAKIIDDDNLDGVGGLTPYGQKQLEAELANAARESLEQGKMMAANEIGVAAPVTSAYAKKALKSRIALYVMERGNKMSFDVQKRMLDILNGDMGKAAGLFELERVIDKAANMSNRSLVGQVVMEPLNEGRYLTFEDAKEQIHAMQRSEILDDKTCDLCLSIDGRILPQSDPMTQIDQVHDSCRGVWVAILKTDAELPEPKPLPKSITKHFNLVGGVPTGNEITQPKKPIVTKDSRVARKVKDGELEI